jgi:hypothetical protein
VAKKFAKKSAEKAPKLSLISPKGTAAYVWLDKPCTKFDPDNEKRECSLIMNLSETAVAEFVTQVEEFAEECGVDSPLKPGKAEGTVQFKAKTSYAVPVFDAQRNKLPDGVYPYGGSTVKLALCLSPWKSAIGAGLSMYLQGVQVLEMKQGTNGDCGFSEEEGYVAETEATPTSGGADEVPF